MNRIIKIIRNIIIIIIICFVWFFFAGLHLSPKAAYERSEKSIHYGPSEIVHIEEFSEGVYILGKYDEWISCTTINRRYSFFWSFGNQIVGIENDESKDIVFSYMGEIFFGVINNDNIEQIEIIFDNDERLICSYFNDSMFIINWREYIGSMNISIKGLDKDNEIVYEEIIR